ncbi:MAG: hypothetical protein R3E79_20320 [Caldilineaceae bacterium]
MSTSRRRKGVRPTQKLLPTAVAGGNPPCSLHYVDRFTVPQFAHQGFFTNITDPLEGAGVTADQYYDFAWEETIYKGGIYAPPSTRIRGRCGTSRISWPRPVSIPASPPTTPDELAGGHGGVDCAWRR